MREGSLEPPTRHPHDWRSPDYTDPASVDAEIRRTFEICHGCRRCFNLCDSFPRLFDLIDAAGDAELSGVPSTALKPVVDACTLCDMCFMTKCPYVPPHAFNLDVPHLMVRYRAMELRQGKAPFVARQLTKTDRNGRLAGLAPALANWATRRGNRLTRPLLQLVAGIHHDADLPRYHADTLTRRAKQGSPEVNRAAPAFGRKAVIFATCFANYNNPAIGTAARAVLAHNGVVTELVYPGCCGMPQIEHGELEAVADKARTTARILGEWVDKGWDVIALVPSCALMMKFEWPLIEPADPAVARLAASVFDITEYLVSITRTEGLAPGLTPIPEGVVLHLSCHARAQNMGAKGADLLRLIPHTPVKVVERCSGHGGSWGIKTANFPVALKNGKPAMTQAADSGCGHLAAECPLAGAHIAQGIESLRPDSALKSSRHPIEILAQAYGLTGGSP
ncbi:MAG: glycerol-3-phosphate dehydrogenase [Magnetospirillum sp.]|nr:MAG: glycerol-3-phosphate dehydrogenase [Magnetospirillum sp.]